MADISVQARVLSRGTTRLRARIQGQQEALRHKLEDRAEEMLRELKVYPGPRSGTKRGRRPNDQSYYKGYQRTYRLQASWQKEGPREVNGSYVVRIFNDVTELTPRGKHYASYVQGNTPDYEGEDTGDHNQAWMHVGIWNNTIDVVHHRQGQLLAADVRGILAASRGG